MSFENLKGQDSAVNYLKASLSNDRVSHAYIFSGPYGVGKRIAAINFAKALNCGKSKSGEPCDDCPSCRKIDAASHPDIFFIKPKEDTSSIKIEDVRAMIRDIYMKPFEARKKVYIIENAEQMKHEAANALLKTLEEPPSDSIIILLAENIKSLFHTIVSRCRVVKFFPLKLKEVEEILINQYSMPEADAHTLSHLSGGRLGEAIKFKEDDIFTKRSLLINKILSRSKADFDFDDLPKEDTKIYLDMMLSWYSDILNIKVGAPDHMLVNIDKIEALTKEASRLSFDYVEDIIDEVILTMMNIDQNANQKLAMGILGMKIKGVSTCTK